MAKNKDSQEYSIVQKKIIVIEAFDDYRRGDAITDSTVIEKVLIKHADKVHVIENSN